MKTLQPYLRLGLGTAFGTALLFSVPFLVVILQAHPLRAADLRETLVNYLREEPAQDLRPHVSCLANHVCMTRDLDLICAPHGCETNGMSCNAKGCRVNRSSLEGSFNGQVVALPADCDELYCYIHFDQAVPGESSPS